MDECQVFERAQRRNDYERYMRPYPTDQDRLADALTAAARLRENIAGPDWLYGQDAERLRERDRETLKVTEAEIAGLTVPVLAAAE